MNLYTITITDSELAFAFLALCVALMSLRCDFAPLRRALAKFIQPKS